MSIALMLFALALAAVAGGVVYSETLDLGSSVSYAVISGSAVALVLGSISVIAYGAISIVRNGLQRSWKRAAKAAFALVCFPLVGVLVFLAANIAAEIIYGAARLEYTGVMSGGHPILMSMRAVFGSAAAAVVACFFAYWLERLSHVQRAD